MRLAIHHSTTYSYDKKVYLEPQHLYFHPSHREYSRLVDFKIKIDPEPAGISLRMDPENNYYQQVWFQDMIDSFTIDMHAVLELSSYNPFQFLAEYHNETHSELTSVYLQNEEELTIEMKKWLEEATLKSNSQDIFSQMIFLNQQIHDGWKHEIREDQNLFPPSYCFNRNAGSCRDLSWLLIHFFRNLGVPSRFASGYAYNDELTFGHELHAWVEAYLTGAGWIGFDPSAGLLANENYVPVCSSYLPKYTLPVQGNFRGDSNSHIKFSVDIQRID